MRYSPNKKSNNGQDVACVSHFGPTLIILSLSIVSTLVGVPTTLISFPYVHNYYYFEFCRLCLLLYFSVRRSLVLQSTPPVLWEYERDKITKWHAGGTTLFILSNVRRRRKMLIIITIIILCSMWITLGVVVLF